MDRYEKMTDEQLIQKLRDGDNRIVDYIMEKYKNLVRKEANAMYLLGGENEDLIQEGMIGLFKAVQNYEPDQNSSFFSFAKLCISRHKNSNPEELLVSQEYAELLESKLEESLSDLENRVLYLHLMGTDYRTIARLLDKSPKTVDNALQRIKAKTQKILEKEKL